MSNRHQKNKTAMAIIRFASKDQNTPDRMEQHANRIYAYCEIRGLKIVDEARFIEGGRGDESQRPRYSAALKRAVANGIRHIVFFSYDRMSRDMECDPIWDLLKADTLCVHFAHEFYRLHSENYDSMTRIIIPGTRNFYQRMCGHES
jgi:hypothetical protein